MVDGGRPLHHLDHILEHYRVVQHGVGLYIGSAQGVDREHLRRVKELVRRTGTPWLTDHLCWGSVDGSYSHDLLPLPYTWQAAESDGQHQDRAGRFLEVPFAIENVSRTPNSASRA